MLSPSAACRDSQQGIQNVVGALLVAAVFLGMFPLVGCAMQDQAHVNAHEQGQVQ